MALIKQDLYKYANIVEKQISRTHFTNICSSFDNLIASAWKQLNELRKTKVKMKIGTKET